METDLESINKKLDLILQLLNQKKQVIEEYSIKKYQDSILISFEYNEKFKDFIKKLGGKFVGFKKAWMFPEDCESMIVYEISEKFPNWKKVEKNT
jgi:hypothetical protein